MADRECYKNDCQDNNALIPRSYVIETMAKMHKYVSDRMNEIAEYQTVKEAEIRAKAISDTVRQLYNLCYLQTWVKEKDLAQLAEQLKKGE